MNKILEAVKQDATKSFNKAENITNIRDNFWFFLGVCAMLGDNRIKAREIVMNIFTDKKVIGLIKKRETIRVKTKH